MLIKVNPVSLSEAALLGPTVGKRAIQETMALSGQFSRHITHMKKAYKSVASFIFSIAIARSHLHGDGSCYAHFWSF
jgi:hypothetical protein